MFPNQSWQTKIDRLRLTLETWRIYVASMKTKEKRCRKWVKIAIDIQTRLKVWITAFKAWNQIYQGRHKIEKAWNHRSIDILMKLGNWTLHWQEEANNCNPAEEA